MYKKKSVKSNKRLSAYQRCQHKIRGALSDYKSEGVRLHVKSNQLEKLHRDIETAMFSCRHDLSTNDRPRFIHWVNRTIAQQLRSEQRISKNFSAINYVPNPLEAGDLKSELHWAICRISACATEIGRHLDTYEKIEHLIANGEHQRALTEAIAHEKAHGESLRGVQLRIALESLTGGIEAQKSYSKEVRTKRRIGLLPLICFYTSERNEEQVSLARFRTQLYERIDRLADTSTSDATYLKYRLLGELPNRTRSLAEVLAVDNLHHMFDLYGTAVAILQKLTELGSLKDSVDASDLLRLSALSIRDPRLARLGVPIPAATNYLPKRRDTALPSLLQVGRRSEAIARFRQLRNRRAVSDPWIQLYGAIACADESQKAQQEYSPTLPIHRQIALILTCPDAENNPLSKVEKLLINIAHFPTFEAIRSLIRVFQRDSRDPRFSMIAVALNSKHYGIEDSWPLVDDENRRESSNSHARARLSERHGPNDHESEISLLGMSLNALSSGDHYRALQLLQEETVVDNAVLRDVLISLKVYCLRILGKFDELVRTVVPLVLENSSALVFSSPGSSIGGLTLKDYRNIDSRIDALIALHAAWKEIEDDSLATAIRYLLRKLLEVDQHTPLSWMRERPEPLDAKDVYIMINICVPQFIDQIPTLPGSKRVLEERIEICTEFSTSNSPEAEYLQAEASSLLMALALEDGERLINSTRIHVDPDAFKRWARKETGEQYFRYAELVKLDNSDEKSVDQLIEEISSSEISDIDLIPPSTESELLLLQILADLKHQFLENPRFGLDYHLSKRVRHQSFVGLIRGPVENHRLVTTKNSIGEPYAENTYWADVLQAFDASNRAAIMAAFQKFNERYDQLLFEAKDRRFHIKTSERTGGMISLDLTPRMIYFIKAYSRLVDSYEELLDFVLQAFWGATARSLDSVREFISEGLKNSLVDEFTKLRAEIRVLEGVSTSGHASFDMSVGQASQQVQREIDVAAGWFNKVSIDSSRVGKYSLDEALRIGVGTARRLCPSLTPEIKISATGSDRDVAFPVLQSLHDVLFVALDNARAHGGLDSPHIDIDVNLDTHSFELELTVQSDMRSSLSRNAELKLDRIRSAIRDQNFERRSRSEGGSGLIKIAAAHSSECIKSLSFGENQEKRFSISVIYRIKNTSLGLSIE